MTAKFTFSAARALLCYALQKWHHRGASATGLTVRLLWCIPRKTGEDSKCVGRQYIGAVPVSHKSAAHEGRHHISPKTFSRLFFSSRRVPPWPLILTGPPKFPVELGLPRPTGFWAKWPVGGKCGKPMFQGPKCGKTCFRIQNVEKPCFVVHIGFFFILEG